MAACMVAFGRANNDWRPARALLEGTIPKESVEYTQLQQIPENDNIIQEACTRGFAELVSVFLKSGLSVNYIVNENKETMLHHAASKGYLSLVKLLLNSGANTNRESLLYEAVKKGHLDVAKHLISVGAKCESYLLREAFSSEAVNGMLKLLLDSGCDPNVQKDAVPLLYFAVGQTNTKAVQIILDAGACVNGTDTHIPLHCAALLEYIPVMQLLLKYGAEINITDKNNLSALEKAIVFGNFKAVEFLIEHGGLRNSEIPLMLSLQHRQFNIAKHLLDSGADINLTVHHELLCEIISCCAPIDLIECLLERGAYIGTALEDVIFYYSSYSNEIKLHIVRLLLIYGANHYVEDHFGNTVLHWACKMGAVELVEYLIRYGLDVDAKNREGKKPYDIATEKGHTNIVKAIIHYQCNKYTRF